MVFMFRFCDTVCGRERFTLFIDTVCGRGRFTLFIDTVYKRDTLNTLQILMSALFML